MVHPADCVRSRTDRKSTRLYSPLRQDIEPRLGVNP